MLSDEFFLGTKLYHQTLTEICSSLAKYLGITQIIYVNIDKQGKIFSICTNYKWIERFLEEQYYKLDLLMVHPNNIHNGFAFDHEKDDKDFKDIFLHDAQVNFEWHNSFAYIEKTTNGGYFGFDFGTTKDNSQIINKLINEAPIVKKVIRKLNENLLHATKDIQERRVALPVLKGDLFYTQKGLVYKNLEENVVKKLLLQDYNLVNSKDEEINLLKVSLSPQEINCLRIYRTTHNIQKISCILNLANTTVASYIENIKNKLKCNNKNDLFEKAEFLEFLGVI